MQIKIPQNVQVEDKIIGPLSMKDLVVAMVGGGLGYLAFVMLDSQTWPFVTIPVALLTVSIIFLKINDMRFMKWVYQILLFFARPQKRVWKNMSDDSVLLDNILNPPEKEQSKVSLDEELKQEKLKKLRQLEEFSKMVDNPLDETLSEEELHFVKK